MKNNQLDEELKERIYLVTCNYIGPTKSDEFKQAFSDMVLQKINIFDKGRE